ncbi:MAG: hypothetical protein QOD42_2844 [Sphingomonadales bacterium]|jgi:hypothetical protein|nr:hypothetical protein [Sphingomonadales bacterium]
MAQGTSDRSKRRTIDEERAYIENLLNTRFNYYLLFVSLLLLPVAGDNPLSYNARAALLMIGALVSAMMFYMVLRTNLLLNALLTRIRKNKRHPYTIAFNAVAGNWFFVRANANTIMVLLVFAITTFFVGGAMTALKHPDRLFKNESAAGKPGTSQPETQPPGTEVRRQLSPPPGNDQNAI